MFGSKHLEEHESLPALHTKVRFNMGSHVCCFSGVKKTKSSSPWMRRKKKWTSLATA